MLMPARSVPLGANSETISWDMRFAPGTVRGEGICLPRPPPRCNRLSVLAGHLSGGKRACRRHSSGFKIYPRSKAANATGFHNLR